MSFSVPVIFYLVLIAIHLCGTVGLVVTSRPDPLIASPVLALRLRQRNASTTISSFPESHDVTELSNNRLTISNEKCEPPSSSRWLNYFYGAVQMTQRCGDLSVSTTKSEGKTSLRKINTTPKLSSSKASLKNINTMNIMIKTNKTNKTNNSNNLLVSLAEVSVPVPESQPTVDGSVLTSIIIATVISAFAILICGSAFCSLFYFRRNKFASAVLLRERSSKLNNLPVHRAILQRADLELILNLINKHTNTLMIKDNDGNTAFDFALEDQNCDIRVITSLLSHSLPIDKYTKEKVSPLIHGYSWTKAVQSDRFSGAIKSILSEHSMLAYELSMVKDMEKRSSVDIACPQIKKLLMMNLYMLKRYDVTTLSTPHHQSETCIVHLAIDREDNDRRVALKFMKDREQFLREIKSRSQGDYSEEYVVGILRIYDGLEDTFFLSELNRKNLQNYPHCIVMEAGDRSLYDILAKENIAGKNMEYIKIIAIELAKAVQHVHSKGFIHGDLKRKKC